jgi:hypothetical protein
MKAATIHEIKQELSALKATELVNLCLRLGKFKKENKELLTYLLFEAHDEDAFAANIKEEVDQLFAEINTSQVYFAKKSLRKILRIVNKYIRYSGSKQTETELLLHFCLKLKASGLAKEKNQVIYKLLQQQLKKLETSIKTLHEDLQYEYVKQLKELTPTEKSSWLSKWF